MFFTFLRIANMLYSSSTCCVPDAGLILYICVNPHNWVLVPYYRWGHWGSKNSSNVSTVTKLVSKKAGICNQKPVCCLYYVSLRVSHMSMWNNYTHIHVWIVCNFWNYWPAIVNIGQTAKWACWLLNCDSRTLAVSLSRWRSQGLIFSMGPWSMHSYQIPSSENY